MDVTYENVPKWSNAKSNTANNLEFCREHYPNVTRGRLQILSPTLYESLRLSGNLQYVPKKYQK